MKKTMIAALLLLLAVGASAQVPESGTVSVMITRALLPGKFSIADNGKGDTTYVRFTRGNLKYQASTNTWDFHEHQYDVIGDAAGNTTEAEYRPTQSAWIDLFYWGTSGWSNNGTIPGYQPWACENENDAAYYYGPPSGYNLTGDYARSDWGSNLSKNGNVFRVMTKDEWAYLFRTRTNCTNLWGFGRVLGQTGVFILPDDWNWNTVDPSSTLRDAAGFTWYGSYKTDFDGYNQVSDDASGVALWNAMENAGAVFLPSTSVRKGTTVAIPEDGDVRSGRYWSSTNASSVKAYCFYFQSGKADPDYSIWKYRGRPVRLVQEIVTVTP